MSAKLKDPLQVEMSCSDIDVVFAVYLVRGLMEWLIRGFAISLASPAGYHVHFSSSPNSARHGFPNMGSSNVKEQAISGININA